MPTRDWLPAAVRERSRARELAVDEALFRQGDRAVAIFEIEHGRLRLIRSTVAGQCTLIPSDSQLAQWRFRRCEVSPTIVASMSRWYLEPDAPYLGVPVTVLAGKVHYAQTPPACWP